MLSWKAQELGGLNRDMNYSKRKLHNALSVTIDGITLKMNAINYDGGSNKSIHFQQNVCNTLSEIDTVLHSVENKIKNITPIIIEDDGNTSLETASANGKFSKALLYKNSKILSIKNIAIKINNDEINQITNHYCERVLTVRPITVITKGLGKYISVQDVMEMKDPFEKNLQRLKETLQELEELGY